MSKRRAASREHFLQGTYISRFRYNGRGGKGRQAADEKDERANHESGHHEKEEEFLGGAETIMIDLVPGDAYTDDTQGLLARERC